VTIAYSSALTVYALKTEREDSIEGPFPIPGIKRMSAFAKDVTDTTFQQEVIDA